MGRYVGKGCRNVTFRIGFPSTDFATFNTLRSLGFADTEGIQFGDTKVSPIDYLTAMYSRAIAKSRHEAPPREEYEYDAFKIDVFGTSKGAPATVTYDIITWNDPEKGIPSSRDTSVPPAVVSHWQGTGKIKQPGVFPPESTIDPDSVLQRDGKKKDQSRRTLHRNKKILLTIAHYSQIRSGSRSGSSKPSSCEAGKNYRGTDHNVTSMGFLHGL